MLKKEITLRWKVPFPTEDPGEILTDSMFFFVFFVVFLAVAQWPAQAQMERNCRTQ